jgi:hypothetical protein
MQVTPIFDESSLLYLKLELQSTIFFLPTNIPPTRVLENIDAAGFLGLG